MIEYVQRYTRKEPKMDVYVYVFENGGRLVGTKQRISEGQRVNVHTPHSHDFLADDVPMGEITTLKTVSIILPGGKVYVENALMDEMTVWEGSLNPICNGVFIRAKTDLIGIEPSVLNCVSPQINGRGFEGKILKRIFLKQGETYTFKKNILGFVIVYGEDEFRGYEADEGDSYTAETGDEILAVVYYKEPVDENASNQP